MSANTATVNMGARSATRTCQVGGRDVSASSSAAGAVSWRHNRRFTNASTAGSNAIPSATHFVQVRPTTIHPSQRLSGRLDEQGQSHVLEEISTEVHERRGYGDRRDRHECIGAREVGPGWPRTATNHAVDARDPSLARR